MTVAAMRGGRKDFFLQRVVVVSFYNIKRGALGGRV